MGVNVSAPASDAKRKAVVARVLAWWDLHRRTLAWRARPGETPDPYRVWLSEVLLQQTTAQAATPYYQAFIDKWPRIEDLAAAPAEAVMSAFAGLGYYSRARNLHACAKEVARRGGRFPSEEAELRALPGVGAYTAAAVAAIAFGRPTRLWTAISPAFWRGSPRSRSQSRRRELNLRRRRERLRRAQQGRRFRAGAHGYRRNALPAAQSRLRLLSACPGLRCVPRWHSGGLSPARPGQDETAPAGRSVFRAPP